MIAHRRLLQTIPGKRCQQRIIRKTFRHSEIFRRRKRWISWPMYPPREVWRGSVFCGDRRLARCDRQADVRFKIGLRKLMRERTGFLAQEYCVRKFRRHIRKFRRGWWRRVAWHCLAFGDPRQRLEGVENAPAATAHHTTLTHSKLLGLDVELRGTIGTDGQQHAGKYSVAAGCDPARAMHRKINA